MITTHTLKWKSMLSPFTTLVNFYSQMPIKKTKINTLLTLREVDPQNNVRLPNSKNVLAKNRPLVVLYDWLYANESALNKYCSLYHDIGLNVLTVRGKLIHFLWPPKGKDLANSLLTYLLHERPKNEKIFIHAFSVGAYNYTICKTIALENKEQFGLFRQKVVGQIFDSIVHGSYANMSSGIAAAINNKGIFIKPLIPIMDLYYRATSWKTKQYYDELVSNFKENPIKVPTLVYYSLDDPMCHVPTMEVMISNWNKRFPEFDVMVKSWDKSVHAAHLKFHEEEYIEYWWKIIGKVILNLN